MNLQDLITAPWVDSIPPPHQPPFTRLDLAFAQHCHLQQPSHRVTHRWLAALTSHQWGRGHACLDLQHWPEDAADQLGWGVPALQHLPDDLVQALDDLPWIEGDASPLVRDGFRLYLRRAWEAEHGPLVWVHELRLRSHAQVRRSGDGWEISQRVVGQRDDGVLVVTTDGAGEVCDLTLS